MRAEEEEVAQKSKIAIQPAFLLQKVQEDDASHHFLDIVVNGGPFKPLPLQLIDDYVVVAMVLIEELLAEGIDREGILEVGQFETAILFCHLP